MIEKKDNKKSITTKFLYCFVAVIVIGILFGITLIRKSTYSSEVLDCGSTNSNELNSLLQNYCRVAAGKGWTCDTAPAELAEFFKVDVLYTSCTCSGTVNSNTGACSSSSGTGSSTGSDSTSTVFSTGCYCNDSECHYYNCDGTVNYLQCTVSIPLARAAGYSLRPEKTEGNCSLNAVDGNGNEVVTTTGGCFCNSSTGRCEYVDCTTSSLSDMSACVNKTKELTDSGYTKRDKTKSNCYLNGGGNGGGGNNSTVTPTTTPTTNATTTPTEKPNTSNNPQTGTVGIIIAWVIGLSAIVYSLWYFKKSFSIK